MIVFNNESVSLIRDRLEELERQFVGLKIIALDQALDEILYGGQYLDEIEKQKSSLK